MSLLKSAKLTLNNSIRYFPLLKNLVLRDIKKKYRSAILGYAWCILNPLFMMLIMTAVFSGIFQRNISNYPVYFFTGRMMYVFIVNGANNILRSITGNSGLLRKARIPYYIFPLSSFISQIVDLLFTLIAFCLVLLFTRTPLSHHVIAFPFVVFQAGLFALGLGLCLSVVNVFVRDTDYVYSVFTVAWMYLTPLFYPIEDLSPFMQNLIGYGNPLYYYIKQVRDVFLYHQWPDPQMITLGLTAGVVILSIGMFLYQKAKNNLIMYL